MLIAAGLIAVKAAFDFDTTVITVPEVNTGYATRRLLEPLDSIRSVYNTGLMQEQLMRLHVALATLLIGAFTELTGLALACFARGENSGAVSSKALSAEEEAELAELDEHRKKVAARALALALVAATSLYIAKEAGIL
jgi:hypothetical protein